jgi:hypothetical protein
MPTLTLLTAAIFCFSHVVKFLKQGDPKYKTFFVRRMQQLANGDRSFKTHKRLKGSHSTIFEAYLEQKSGHRILYTEEGSSIVVWFVAKHKEVSRLMRLMDDAKNRSARQQLPQSLMSDLQNEGLITQQQKEEVLLDVFGNVPLKLYDVHLGSIDDITKEAWTPTLHLTEEERDVVETEGTVLLLGRSGTGKVNQIIFALTLALPLVALRKWKDVIGCSALERCHWLNQNRKDVIGCSA